MSPQKERTVLITGSSRGLGLEWVRQSLQKGWRVFATCRDPDSAKELAELQKANPKRLLTIALDVCDPSSVSQAAAEFAQHSDSLDILVNNAGMGADGEDGFLKVDPESMDQVLRTNAIGPVLVTQAFHRFLKAGSAPRVVSITSGAGLLKKELPPPNLQLSYGGSKAALHFFIQKMAADLKPDGIICIGLGPGFVLTDMTKDGDREPPLRPPESVTGQIQLVEKVSLHDTGHFFAHNGRRCHWEVG